MALNHRRVQIAFGIVLALMLAGLGCGLTDRSGARNAENQAAAGPLPTRTPWPTFTPMPEGVVSVPPDQGGGQAPTSSMAQPTPTPMLPPTEAPDSMPTDTPIVEVPVPTETPAPTPTNTPAPPPPPPPTNTSAPPPTPLPQYQFSPGPWSVGERNDAMVRFYGYIKDTGGNGVNGYSVKASCGDFSVLSYPSGPSVVAPDWAPGWYDIVFPNPVSCNFTLQVVEYQCDTPGAFDAQCKQYESLSEAVPASTDVAAGETIIVADWIKNW